MWKTLKVQFYIFKCVWIKTLTKQVMSFILIFQKKRQDLHLCFLSFRSLAEIIKRIGVEKEEMGSEE